MLFHFSTHIQIHMDICRDYQGLQCWRKHTLKNSTGVPHGGHHGDLLGLINNFTLVVANGIYNYHLVILVMLSLERQLLGAVVASLLPIAGEGTMHQELCQEYQHLLTVFSFGKKIVEIIPPQIIKPGRPKDGARHDLFSVRWRVPARFSGCQVNQLGSQPLGNIGTLVKLLHHAPNAETLQGIMPDQGRPSWLAVLNLWFYVWSRDSRFILARGLQQKPRKREEVVSKITSSGLQCQHSQNNRVGRIAETCVVSTRMENTNTKRPANNSRISTIS